jgi:Kef-type K+ transport system membrane component KefB
MFVAGTHVPVRSGAIRAALSAGLVLAWLERNGSRVRLPKLSANRKFALELRIQLAILFALSAVAVFSQVSVMLAGFAVGLAVAAVGEPRRLARQLFALADGFFGPLFFVWLGASRALRDLAEHPQMIVLGLSLGLATLLTHATTRVLGLPLSFGRLPVIAVTAVASGWAQPRAASVPK